MSGSALGVVTAWDSFSFSFRPSSRALSLSFSKKILRFFFNFQRVSTLFLYKSHEFTLLFIYFCSLFLFFYFSFLSNLYAQLGAETHNPEVKTPRSAG